MQSIWPAIVAVAGTLLGSTITYLFQRMSSKRAEAYSFKLQLRAERVAAYNDFIGELAELSRVSYHWRERYMEDPKSPDALDARVEVMRLVSSTFHVLSRIHLVTDNPELADAAGKAYDLTKEMLRATTKEKLDSCLVESNQAINLFTNLASQNAQISPV